MARRYLTSTLIRSLVVSDHDAALPKPELFTAHEERIDCLSFERCTFGAPTHMRVYGRTLADALTGARGRNIALVVARDDSGQLFVKNRSLPGTFSRSAEVPSSLHHP